VEPAKTEFFMVETGFKKGIEEGLEAARKRWGLPSKPAPDGIPRTLQRSSNRLNCSVSIISAAWTVAQIILGGIKSFHEFVAPTRHMGIFHDSKSLVGNTIISHPSFDNIIN